MRDCLHFSSKSPTCNPCHICSLAKQQRLSFRFNNHIASPVFDLVHYDIWGPFKTPTYAGYKYFMTSVDDCSRYTWIFLMNNKSDVVHIVPRFIQLVHTLFSKVIKIF